MANGRRRLGSLDDIVNSATPQGSTARAAGVGETDDVPRPTVAPVPGPGSTGLRPQQDAPEPPDPGRLPPSTTTVTPGTPGAQQPAGATLDPVQPAAGVDADPQPVQMADQALGQPMGASPDGFQATEGGQQRMLGSLNDVMAAEPVNATEESRVGTGDPIVSDGGGPQPDLGGIEGPSQPRVLGGRPRFTEGLAPGQYELEDGSTFVVREDGTQEHIFGDPMNPTIRRVRDRAQQEFDRASQLAGSGERESLSDMARNQLTESIRRGHVDPNDPRLADFGLDFTADGPLPDELAQGLADQGFDVATMGPTDASNPQFASWAEGLGIDPAQASLNLRLDRQSFEQQQTRRGQAQSIIEQLGDGIVHSGPFNPERQLQYNRDLLNRIGIDPDTYDPNDPEQFGQVVQYGVQLMKDLSEDGSLSINEPGAGAGTSDPAYQRLVGLLGQAAMGNEVPQPGEPIPPDRALRSRTLWKALGEAGGRDMSHLQGSIDFYEKALGQEGVAGDMANRASTGGFQDLQGSTIQAGTGNALNRGFATQGPLGNLNQLVQGATQRVATGPNRQELASRALSRFEEETEPAFQQRLRGVGQRAAALGRVGSGLTTSDLGTVTQRREEDLARVRSGLADQAAGQELGDRIAGLNAILGSRGQTFNQLFGQEQLRIGTEQQQQGFQRQQSRDAISDAIQQFLLSTGEEQRQFGNELALANLNLQNLAAFGDPTQGFGDPQTNAILQLLAQIQAG